MVITFSTEAQVSEEDKRNIIETRVLKKGKRNMNRRRKGQGAIYTRIHDATTTLELDCLDSISLIVAYTRKMTDYEVTITGITSYKQYRPHEAELS